MYLLILSLITLQCISSAVVQHSAYHPVFEYDVPVASQPIVYTAPSVPTGPYYGSYAVHTTPAVSHTYSQTQTHPVAYVKPEYFAPSAGTSRVEHSRIIVPQTNRIYRYQTTNQQYASPQPSGTQYRKQGPGQNFQGEKRMDQQAYSTLAQNNENQWRRNDNGQTGRNVYANRMAYTNNGEQVKLRRYQVHRPGIQKEFYDVEERVIIRPVGSALIELDPPTKKQDITERSLNDRSHASNYNQYNSQRFKPSGRYGYNVQSIPDCGYGYVDQSPVYDYSPPATAFDNPDTQYHPTTFAPTTTTTPTADDYPTAVPSQTYLPPYSTDQPSTTSSSSEYNPTTTYSSSPGQYETTTGYNQYAPTETSVATSTADSSTTPKQSDIYISSTTPVSVTIVDKNEESDKRQDIIYSDENTPDQFQNELPPRGDISQYRAEQPDKFYHELPRSPYTNEPDQPIVYSRSRGEPSTKETNEDPDVIEIKPHDNSNSTINQNRTSYGNNQQARLIQLYTNGNGGLSEVGQTEYQDSSRYTDQGIRNSEYQDVGNVRARVVSVTPPPSTALPTETINRRRIIVSKPVTTVQEVVEPDNSTTNAQNGNYRGNYADGNIKSRYENKFESDNENYNYGTRHNANYRNDNNNQNSNSEFKGNDQNSKNYDFGVQTTRSNYEEPLSSTGVHISTTPSTGQRIIYVQPVAQDFAQQRAVPPKKPKN